MKWKGRPTLNRKKNKSPEMTWIETDVSDKPDNIKLLVARDPAGG